MLMKRLRKRKSYSVDRTGPEPAGLRLVEPRQRGEKRLVVKKETSP